MAAVILDKSTDGTIHDGSVFVLFGVGRRIICTATTVSSMTFTCFGRQRKFDFGGNPICLEFTLACDVHDCT